MTYKAIVCKITGTEKHPNADRLQICTVLGGFKIITDLNTKVGDLGIYFPIDGQLSEEFARINNLIEIIDPATGKKIGGGYLNNKRRIRAMSLRGVKSEGLWLPHTSIYSFYKSPKQISFEEEANLDMEGYEFTHIGDNEICRKYVGLIKGPSGVPGEKKKRMRERDYAAHEYFKRHIDTPALKRVLNDIPPNVWISISAKLHGTSAVTGYVLEDNKLPWYSRAANKIMNLIGLSKYEIKPTKDYRYLVGSRNVVFVGERESKGDTYYKDNFRFDAADSFKDKLKEGETVYYEIVGYLTNNSPIMKRHSITKDIKKSFKGTNKFNEIMTYSYGCEVGKWDIYVYRITQMDNKVIKDLSTDDMIKRASELGLKAVPQLERFFYNGDTVDLLQRVSKYLSDDEFKPSILDPTHIEEGICLRIEDGGNLARIIKHHSFIFKVLEGNLEIPDEDGEEQNNDG